MGKIILFITLICFTITSKAQTYEAGFFVGGSNYIGDIGPEYYINPNNLMGGIIYKWNMNPRISFRGTFTYAKLSSDDLNATNIQRLNRYPFTFSFLNSIKELAFGIEFNYFDYNLDDYRHTHTPYLLLEIAAFNYNVISDDQSLSSNHYKRTAKTSFAIPFGIGYKTKLVQDFAIAFEIRARYTFVDNLEFNNITIFDGSKAYKYDVSTFGNPTSNDWYILSGISLVYTFGRPPCYATPH